MEDGIEHISMLQENQISNKAYSLALWIRCPKSFLGII